MWLGQKRIWRRLLRMSRFFYRKNSLTLSQQVSPRRHCTGSLQNRVWRRLLRMSRWMWSSKLFIWSGAAKKTTISACWICAQADMWWENIPFPQIQFFLNQTLSWAVSSTWRSDGWCLITLRSNRQNSDACLRYFCDGQVIARLEDSEEAMNKFAKSPTIKDEVKLLLVILIYWQFKLGYFRWSIFIANPRRNGWTRIYWLLIRFIHLCDISLSTEQSENNCSILPSEMGGSGGFKRK